MRPLVAALLLTPSLLAMPAAAQGQDMPMDHAATGHQVTAPDAGADAGHASTGHRSMNHAQMDHDGMDHGGMDHGGMDMHGMVGALGGYTMMRDASGTAWQPDSTPMFAIMGGGGNTGWSTMVHGFATLTWDRQTGPRGDEKTFSTSMLMGMVQRPLGDGTLTLRGMVSLDPLMGKRGYPLLLSTGETADGRTELVDRQHPHDAFMELSASVAHPIAGKLWGFAYFGLPGEPALGPATFMHRLPGMANPEAPISHHWLDSTHVTFGVATAGLVLGRAKLEGSLFTGREPDQHRWDIERPQFDSWSVRATVNPTANLSLQVSHGYLKSPESLHPDEDVHRTTASATHNLPLGRDRHWQTTVAWGRNAKVHGDHGAHPTDAFLLESVFATPRWTVFGRGEVVDKDELFEEGEPLHGRTFTVGKLSLGGFLTFPVRPFAFDCGGLVSKFALPAAIRPVYGANATGMMLFARVRIVG